MDRAFQHWNGHRLYTDRFVVVAAPSVPRSVNPTPAVELAAPPEREWHLNTAEGASVVHPKPVLRCTSLVLLRDAVLAGAGAGLIPLGLIGDELASGKLVLWGRLAGEPVEVWILDPSRHLQSAKVTAFVSAIRALHPGSDAT